MDNIIRFEIPVNAPVKQVWDMWVKAELLNQWLCNDANISLEAGGAYELFWDTVNRHSNSTIGCTIIEVTVYEHLHIEWKGPDHFASLMNDKAHQTKVHISFESLNDKTKLTLVHYGWGRGNEWEKAKQWHIMAWREGLSRLKKLFQ